MIRVEPTQQSLARLEQFCRNLERLTDLGAGELAKVSTAVRRGFTWNFEHESAGGAPWVPLAPRTVRERRELGFGGEHMILQRTRSLKLSLVDPTHPHNVTTIRKEGGRTVLEYGSSDPRFPKLHAGGTTDEGYEIPPRPMVVLGEWGIAQLEQTLYYIFTERARRL